MLTRRQFSQATAAATATALFSRALPANAGAATAYTLTAQPGTARLLEPHEPETRIWGYGGASPGPTLRVRQGEEFSARLVNNIDQPTTIHWHGIRNDNRMDGVAGLTQAPAQPGATFDYRFTPPDAGSYWYHPHNRTWEQMARGLYGLFIVEEESPPKSDRDLAMVFDDWRLDEAGQIHQASLGALRDRSHAGRLGNVMTINGNAAEDFGVTENQRLRLRLANTANARVIAVRFEGHTPRVIALDGQPVNLRTPDSGPLTDGAVVLAPAQRADIMLDMSAGTGAKTRIIVETGREKLVLGHFVYDAARRQRAAPLNDTIHLPPNPMNQTIDLRRLQDVDLVMAGGAMSALAGATYRGKAYASGDLASEHGLVWAFNGVAGMPEQPLVRAERGTAIRIKMVNDTAWPHAMHFHGHHVREFAHSARTPQSYFRDTVFVDRRETVTVVFNADNPGKWMLHCHMLEHQAGGMATWFEVV